MEHSRFVILFFIFFSLAGLFVALSSSNGMSSSNDTQEWRTTLLDPEMAPENIKPLVMQGFRILFDTKKHAPQYAGDEISCTNCHFNCGNTFGGENNGISLVGVTKKYPRAILDNPHYTLEERINACFTKSLNGKPVPLKSKEMKAMIAYLEWISKGVSNQAPWLGLKKLRSHAIPNAEKGNALYQQHCAACHGKDGEGQLRPDNLKYPPLWGNHSFNQAAGMNDLPTLAAFIYDNMPYQEPRLTVEEVLDIAAYITSQPRPIEIRTP
ncbi:c-type cytochrome [Parachlamydia acanthamoebae]|uniref:Cytochrome c domain-containing protein n=2 Tax=Parachlamydia acanthamoebae TaxID=83552 RepID=F8KYU5_PARAV|nr:c-type cytochrome [Parachlamydia acanthamoebae]EFB41073.1 hypothetical protein pah_c050o028 [Parachlamydia acanthamoebae str. Hall's coccus]KIA78205.1 hypothetical protein DB43_EL00160 [Parachlamydia acanthamoebae]CCB86057.1 putative uncharacterized protein [Parachlamydia acanthamoebae UV-7]